ncbi:MAG: hypothetical protein QOI28_1287 [Mycobacterium sp.]|nr:hypothetical protein [Mycobacterium sp.]MDT5124666.1 hypothetical protein [Mycobacterium sp.]MDT5189036.1 hypothetical protein [Mycobacterium sp.]MDT5363432.1 hypothetical protein [Mycobacterium sp.]
MLTRILIGVVAAGAAVIGVPGVAGADPEPAPPPPPPNANAFAPLKASDFSMQNGEVYAFAVPGDIACVMSRGSGMYGCSGPIPAAPNNANAVTGSQQGPASFANADRPLYIFDTLPKRLPAGSRINFRNVACGTDGTMTVCNNNFDGGGFVISPTGSFIIEPNNPLLLNTGEGHNPYFN